jgi:multiple sugar transport system substrate-binding protein
MGVHRMHGNKWHAAERFVNRGEEQMNNNKSLAIVLIIALGLVPVLSACGPAPTPATVKETVVVSEEKVVTVTPEPAAPPETVTITYWHLPDVMDVDLAAKQVEAFEAAFPYIKVEVVPISTEIAEEGILAALAAGTPPDVCQMNATEVAKYGQWGALVALDQFSDWEVIKARLPEGAIQSFSGHVYAMPWRTNPVVLFYNKGQFEEAGLDPNTPPSTWSEFLEIAEALTRDSDGDGVIDRWGYVSYPDIHKWYRPYFGWSSLYYSATGGKDTIAEDGSEAIVNSPEGLKTLEFLKTLYSQYASADITSYTDAFFQGQGAMLTSGTFMVPRIRDNAPSMDFGMVAIPVPDDGPVDHAITHSDERDIVIFSLSEKQEAAWEFVKFISGPDQAVTMMETTGMYSVLKDLTGYPDVAEYLSQDPYLFAGAEEMNYIRLPVPHPKHQEIMAALANELSAALVVGAKSTDQALADAQAAINAILGVE